VLVKLFVSYSSLLLHSRDVYCTFRTQYFKIRVGCLASASALASHIAGLVNIPVPHYLYNYYLECVYKGESR